MASNELFDILDPWGEEAERQREERRRKKAQQEEEDRYSIQPFPVEGEQKPPDLNSLLPEEEKSNMLLKLAGMGSSGLSTAGYILDTPGALVRGVLAGDPLSVFRSSDQRVSGRDLNRMWGLSEGTDNWGNFGGGLATEVALDPLTYLAGLGIFGKGVTQASKAASKIGLLDNVSLLAREANMGPRMFARKTTPQQLLDRITDVTERSSQTSALNDVMTKDYGASRAASMLNEPLERQFNVSVPLLGKRYTGASDLLGEGVGDFVAGARDSVSKAMDSNAYISPFFRRYNQIFEADTLGKYPEQSQWDARNRQHLQRRQREANQGELARLQAISRDSMPSDLKSLGLAENTMAFGDKTWSRAWRNVAENQLDRNTPEINDLLMNSPGQRGLYQYAQDLISNEQRLSNREGLGLSKNVSLFPNSGFFRRQWNKFDAPQQPSWPAGSSPPPPAKMVSLGAKARAVSIDDLESGRRKGWTDVHGASDTLERAAADAQLQSRLRSASDTDAPQILEDWYATQMIRGAAPSSQLYPSIADMAAQMPYTAPQKLHFEDIARNNPLFAGQSDAVIAAEGLRLHDASKLISAAETRGQNYIDFADRFRNLDPQHAQYGVPLFQNSLNDLVGYARDRQTTRTDASFLRKLLAQRAVNTPASQMPGGTHYTPAEALEKLGFHKKYGLNALAKDVNIRSKILGKSAVSLSFPKNFVDEWAGSVATGQIPEELSPLLKKFDDYTKSFKTLALLWPARYTRDAYSGAFAAASQGGFSPLDWYRGVLMRGGDYSGVEKALRNTRGYSHLTPEERILKFKQDAGAVGLSGAGIADDISSRSSTSSMPELYPGASPPTWSSLGSRAYNPQRSWTQALKDFSPLRTRGGTGNPNPLLELGDRAAGVTDAGNRYGTYLNLIKKGYSPREAKRITDLTQVDYSSQAFTPFERNVLKRLFPFYSYTKGIVPLVTENLIQKPRGIQGLSVRALSRGTEPSDQSFTPEYLRQSASLPLPSGLAGIGLPEGSPLKRFVTNIDLPYESTMNLFSPGVGNSVTTIAADSAKKTALNLLGQLNPLLKVPLESATNRQFYSGRQLSDLYSMLEQHIGPVGRGLEQVTSGLPGGSRLLGTYRQITDSRLSPADRASKLAVNTLLGIKLQDVDQERTKRLAARDMLNQLLETVPGVRKFENISVPPEVQEMMSPEQKKQYLLYRILQGEAAKRAREKKKKEKEGNQLSFF